MRSFVCFLVGIVLLTSLIPCWAIDAPSSIPDTKTLGQVRIDRPLTEDEALLRRLLNISASLAKMDLHGLIVLKQKIASGESEAKEHLSRTRMYKVFEEAELASTRQLYETTKEQKRQIPQLASIYEDLKKRIPQMERRMQKYPKHEARAKQAVKDWQKLSRIVGAAVLEREQSGDGVGPKKK